MRRLACCLSFLALLTCVMGADSVNLASSTPNPNKTANLLEGMGGYTLDPANVLVAVTYGAEETTTKQLSSNEDKIGANGAWVVRLNLVAGTYDTFAYMKTADKGNGKTQVVYAPKGINGVVVK